MVDDNRFRYRRDAGARDDGDVGARAPSAQDETRFQDDTRYHDDPRFRNDPRLQDEPRAPTPTRVRPQQPAAPAAARPTQPAPAQPARAPQPQRAPAPPQAPAPQPVQRVQPAPRAPQVQRDLPTQPADPTRTQRPPVSRDVPTQVASHAAGQVTNQVAGQVAAPRPAPRPAAAPPRPAAPRAPQEGAAGGAMDPLAELARLIGEQDPFADFGDLQAEPPPQPVRAQRPASIDPETRMAPGQDPRLTRRAAPPRETTDPTLTGGRPTLRPAAPRQTIERVAADPTRAPLPPQASAPDARTAMRSQATQPRRVDATLGETGFGDPATRPAPRPAAAPNLPPRRQASLAAPPQRAALMPPRSDSEPVDRSATSVRLGYGSLAHQAQVPPNGRGPQDYDAPQPGDDDMFAEVQQPTRAAQMRAAQMEEARRQAPQPRQPAPQQPQAYARADEQQPAGYAYASPRGEEDYEEYDEAYDPQYGEDGYMPPHGEEVYEGETKKRKGRSALLLVACVLGLVVAGTAGVFAYRMAVHGGVTSSGGTPPVIKADTSPSKIMTPPSSAPQDAQQKLIYDRVGNGNPGTEKMLTREEQPVDVNAVAARAPTPAATDPVINSLTTEPKRVRTLTVRADGSVAADSAPQTSAPAATGPSPGVQALQAYAASQMPGAPPAMVNLPAAGSAKIDPPPVARTGDFVVQVASQRSEADALGSWKVLQARYPNLLGSYVASVKKADLGDRGIYYRAQVGPFASKDQASDLCKSLQAQGGDCMVTKN